MTVAVLEGHVAELYSLDITSPKGSRAGAERDEQLIAQWSWPIVWIACLALNTGYDKMHYDGSIVPCFLLTAIGLPKIERRTRGAKHFLKEPPFLRFASAEPLRIKKNFATERACQTMDTRKSTYENPDL